MVNAPVGTDSQATITKNTSLRDLMQLLIDRKVNRAWVLNDDNQLWKVITKSDILREFAMFEFYRESN